MIFDSFIAANFGAQRKWPNCYPDKETFEDIF